MEKYYKILRANSNESLLEIKKKIHKPNAKNTPR